MARFAVVLVALFAFVAVANATIEPEWFTQVLDHFDTQNNATWQQLYYVNATYWNGSGPVFFQFGGEGAISPEYVTTLQMAHYAKTFGALMLALEHRFYGQSQPFASETETMLSTQNLRFLSSQQALADAAHFLTIIRPQLNVPASSKTIVFGCSYPGSLSAWFRLKYPHIAYASVANSAPVQATADFFKYLDVVDTSLAFFSPECDAAIASGVNYIQQALTTSNGQVAVGTLFNTCTIPNNANDIATLMSTVMDPWMGTVQYANEKGISPTPTMLCNLMGNSTNAAATLADIVNSFYGPGCIDISYEDSIAEMKNETASAAGVGERQWMYQSCMEFGYWQTTDSSNTAQPFGDLVPLSYWAQQCEAIYGIAWDLNRINTTNEVYGGNALLPDAGTNILFTNSIIDPWHSLGIYWNISSSLQAILLQDGQGHCAIMEPSQPNDPPGVIAARLQTARYIASWLAQ